MGRIVLPIIEKKYHKAMLTAISGLIPGGLTPFEIQILANMFIHNIKSLNKNARKDLITILDTSKYNFNNYINKLKNKRVLIEVEGGLEVNPLLSNAIENKSFEVEFNIN